MCAMNSYELYNGTKNARILASLICSITSFPGRVWRHGSRRRAENYVILHNLGRRWWKHASFSKL